MAHEYLVLTSMRSLLLFFWVPLVTVLAGEQPTYAFRDGRESFADSSERVNAPRTKIVDLGNNIKMELVLIPAGRFVMGTPEPVPVDEEAFHKKISTGQTVLAVSGGVLLVLLGAVVAQSIVNRQRPRFSLARLCAMTVVAGFAVWGCVHWWQSLKGLEEAKLDYPKAKERFKIAERDQKPAHLVTLTRPFYMGQSAVTQEQYQAVMGTNPSKLNGINNPVECVSWNDAQQFCKKLTNKIKESTRLPTEAEWEYACRAGTRTRYHSGDLESDLGRVAWYSKNSGDTTHAVGQKEPNGFGLYDLHGNVAQWCQDWFSDDYYSQSLGKNPTGPEFGHSRVLRGGNWGSNAEVCGTAYRARGNPDARSSIFGFRIVLVPGCKVP